MKRNKGFTLLELQIASLVMVVVLVATGVIFYFALASIRYLHDAFTVYTNATTAMKIITQEAMLSNCYGSSALGNPGYTANPDSFYGVSGYIQEGPAGTVSGEEALYAYMTMPSLGGSNAMVSTDGSYMSGLYLRQVTQASSQRGDVSNAAGDFPWHETVQIYRDDTVEPGKIKLMIERYDPQSTTTTTQVIADNVTRFDFQPIAYNMLHVFLTVEGTVPDPWGSGTMHSLTLSKAITLRCAPSVTPIPYLDTW